MSKPPSSTMLDHVVKLYEYMSEHSVDGVYLGTKTEAYRAVGLSQTYYTPLWAALQDMGSIELLMVGGRGRRTHIRLLKHPEPDDFAAVWSRRDLTSHRSVGKLQEDVEAINRRLPAVDLASIVVNFETRIARLEKALDNLEGE